MYSVGRKSIKHNGFKVFSSNKSIQGPWRPGMFQHLKQHEMLHIDPLPQEDLSDEALIKKGILRRPYAKSPRTPIDSVTKKENTRRVQL